MSLNRPSHLPITVAVPTQTQPLATLPQLRGLLEVTRLVREEGDLTRLVDAIAATIADALGFRTVAISLYRPAEGDFLVSTVYGSESARELLLGRTRPPDAWDPYFVERFLRRGAYLVPRGEGDWEGVTFHLPELEPSADPDAWHPDDALMVPMRGADGSLLGVVSVDEPESGLLPTDEELDVLVAFAEHVIGAIEAVQAAAAAARDRASLAQLLDVSASLVELDSVDDVLQEIASGISRALEFEKVAVCIARDGGFSPAGIAGWEMDDPGLGFTLGRADLDLLFVPEFELEGCYLIENDVARALVPVGSTYSSQRGGAGPRAWSHHWLLVPLIERDGSCSGFIWVDDPADSMLPSRERLQALRTFANQATVALRAAQDFESLNARNRELAALHDTTLDLLDRLDVDALLETIVDRACSLLDTPHGSLYLVDDEAGVLEPRVRLGFFARAEPVLVRRGEGLAGRVWETGRTIAVDDYSSWSGRLPQFAVHAPRAVLSVPLCVGDDVRGILGLAYGEPERGFGRDEVALLERFAQLASLALESARLYGAVRQSEELHRQVVDGSTDLIALLGVDDRVVLASRAYADVLGHDPNELLGTPLSDLLHPDDLAVVRAHVVDHTITEPITARMRHRDGHWVLVEGVTTAIRDADGAVELKLVIARDITERERLQEQLRQGQKMESIGRLAGGIAHDFNNLLTAIGGYAELGLADLESGAAEAAADSMVQISRASNRAAELTAQLLAFSRKQVLHLREVDLNEIVSDMASMLARMLGEDIVLSAELDPDLGTVMADPGQLEQVVLNLAINARDAMPTGGNLWIRTRDLELRHGEPAPAPELLPGSYVLLDVQDDGVGMVLTLTDRIFEPFFTTKDVGEGTGLGLATVHGIVSQSGGAVWVDSKPGVGTTFTVCLPRAV